MVTRTCDFCGVEIKERNLLKDFKFLLFKGASAYEFSAELSYSANFCTTNMDWCDSCIKNGIKKALEQL